MAPAPAPLRLLSPAAAEETDGAGARRLGSEPGESADPARPVRHPRGTPSGAAGELRALGPGGARAPGAHRCGGLLSCAPRPGRRPPAPGASASRSESLGPGEDRCRIRERFLEIICMENHVFLVLSALGVDEDLLCFLCVYLVRAPGWLLPLITLS
ncbi:translation initiation factor IF-2-like isoform X6 [Felis catus]|uniref:translation initiation factor IF-2-like isoform X6 n=1 Tax=Felis catus TaxID=9685 RepID=UPI001D19A4C4|nr:translation initiation factor IF-2-like isoform X6 [Felis catus]